MNFSNLTMIAGAGKSSVNEKVLTRPRESSCGLALNAGSKRARTYEA